MGALAFSLGLGMAVATGGGLGVASADTGDSTGASSTSTGAEGDSSRDAETTNETETSGDTETGTETGDDDDAGEPAADYEAGVDEEPSGAEEQGDTEQPAGGDESEPGEDDATSSGDEHPERSGSARDDAPQDDGDEDEASDEASDEAAEFSDADKSSSTSSIRSALTTGDPASAPSLDVDVVTVDAERVTTAAVAIEQPAAASAPSIVSRFLAVFGMTLPQKAIDSPTTPATPGVLMGVMDWVRRELDRFLHNDLPTPDPRQIVQGTGTGVVVGTLNTTDEENDRLSFNVTDQPRYGRVVVYSNGTYVYTPRANIPPELAAAGWSDSFTVRIIDRGFSARKITDFLRADVPGVSLPVTVTVAGYTGTPVQESLADGLVMSAAASDTVTKGFDVINASSRPVKLISYGDHAQNQVTQSPEVNSILQPGESHHFEVVYYFLGLGQVNPTYAPVDGGAAWKIHMDVQPFSDTQSRCTTTGAGVCNKYGSPIVLMDQPGGVIEIPAGQGQKQAEALNLLCNGSAPATCSFQVKRQDKIYAKEREIWSYQTAESQANIEDTAKFSTSTSHSIEISAKAGVTIKSIVELEIAAKYTAKFEETVETVKTIKFIVPPWTHKVQLAEMPILRYTGDFTVKLGNTTYHLRDVYFDVPDKDRAIRYREVSTAVPRPTAV
ncbi:MAG: Ig-like domain-containing protein [Mycobacterium sp.]|nr:Ig-like domain-containing protein [Mycobacterium sp.]